ncbi:MAG: FimB/Mfa2 family fimbrial subunit [Alistipes sp.]|nr:FimB/Mfa2 family fimbrial subunit [Alistipes sp.]
MKKLLLYLCMPLVSFVLLTGCIKEDMDDCERCTLTFSYLGDVNYDIFPQHITCVSLYVFDADNRVVQTKRIEQNELKAFQGTKLNLEPGAYRVIGVGNQYDKTVVENVSSSDYSQIIFRHPNAGKGVVEGNDSLYLGAKDIVIPSDYWYEDDVPFRSSHLKVSYTVKGYVNPATEAASATRAGSGYLELRVKNLLPQTDFNNRAHGDKITYNPVLELNTKNGDHEGYFNIMRHAKDSDVEFELIDKASQEVVHTLALKDFLNEFTQIDVTKQEVLIPIVVEFKNIGVTVTIPDWMINDVTPDYGN